MVMHYYSFFVCLVAVSLCFTPHRRNDEFPLGQEKPLVGTDDILMSQVQGNRDSVTEDIKTCRQFLNGITAISLDFGNDTASLDFVRACERVVAILDQAVDRSLHRHAQSRDHRYLQGSAESDRLYFEGHEIAKTTSSLLNEEILARDANASESTHSDTAGHPSKKYRREEICEDKVCKAERLGEICNAKKIDPRVAQTCKMCYPGRNAQLINAHCQAKWRKERKAFYVVSFILIAVTLASGLALYLRRRYLRTKNPQVVELAESGINPPGELYYYDGPILPPGTGSSLVVNCSPEPCQYDESKHYRNHWNEDEGDVVSTSFAQRRLRQLGILSRTGRKRVHDLFDLEALQSKRGTTKRPQRQSDDEDKVPVMPWAPNASIRSPSRSSSCIQPAKKFEKPTNGQISRNTMI